MPYNTDTGAIGSFLPTTQVWDLGLLEEIDVNSTEFKELLVRLHQEVGKISQAVNGKETGLYLKQEFNSGNTYFNPTSSSQLDLRPVYRMVVDAGALGIGLTVTAAHGLTIGSTWSFVHMYGAASNTTTNNYYPIPSSTILMSVDATNVTIVNNSGLAFLTCVVVLEYLKQ